jgi:hypothetical protein
MNMMKMSTKPDIFSDRPLRDAQMPRASHVSLSTCQLNSLIQKCAVLVTTSESLPRGCRFEHSLMRRRHRYKFYKPESITGKLMGLHKMRRIETLTVQTYTFSPFLVMKVISSFDSFQCCVSNMSNGKYILNVDREKPILSRLDGSICLGLLPGWTLISIINTR